MNKSLRDSERSWELGYKKVTNLLNKTNKYSYTPPLVIITQYKYTVFLMRLLGTKLNSYYLGVSKAIEDWESKNPNAKKTRRYTNGASGRGVTSRQGTKDTRDRRGYDSRNEGGYEEVTVNLPFTKSRGEF